MLRLQHHHRRVRLDAIVEVDDVLVEHADAARRDRRADIFRLVGAVDAEQRILVTLIEIQGACAERIVGAARDGRPSMRL